MNVLGIIAGILTIIAVGVDAFEAMLLPRRVRRPIRLIRFYFRLTWGLWRWVGKRLIGNRSHDSFLSLYGPISMIGLLSCWALGLILGFALLQWGVHQGQPHAPTFSTAMYFSGATFFTVGYGDVLPLTHPAKILAVVEAGSGLAFIAVTISYLPVLYQLFSRREAHVIQLDARAGSPPTATALLCRHGENEAMDELSALFREWEQWCAELVESHLSYPMLSYYRSQHDNQSWLSALTAVIDTCALILVGAEDLPPLQARMTFTMARQILVEITRSLAVSPSRYDGGDRLDHEDYLRLTSMLADAGVGWAERTDSEVTLAALRATYEPLLDGLGKRLLLPLARWMPSDMDGDHWQRGHRGMIASKLVEEMSQRNAPQPLAKRLGRLSRRGSTPPDR